MISKKERSFSVPSAAHQSEDSAIQDIGGICIQFSIYLVTYLHIAGFILAGIMVVLLGIGYAIFHRISWVPLLYAAAAVTLFFYSSFVIIEITLPTVPLYTWIGFYGGWFILILAYFQTFYELMKTSG